MKKVPETKVVDLEKLNKVGIQKFFIWPREQYENHNGHHFPVEITEISVEITEISVGIHRNFVFWIWILFPFGISEIRRNFGRNFVSGKRRDSEKKRKGKPWGLLLKDSY